MLTESSISLLIGQETDLRLIVTPTDQINLKSTNSNCALIRVKFAPNSHRVCQIDQFSRCTSRPAASFSPRPTLRIRQSNSKSNSKVALQRLISISTRLFAILIQISILLAPSQFHLNPCKSVAAAAPGQYVASFLNSLPDDLDLNEAETALGPAAHSSRQHDEEPAAPGKQSRNLIEYLQSLPISSVGQKHTALIECNPIEEMKKNSKFKLVWLKLVRNTTTIRPQEVATADQNDITLLSLGERMVTPDKRFRVHHQPPSKWTLTIDNVNQNDDKTYFLCQAAGGGQTRGTSFLGGAQLNVLVPPQIVEQETSPSLVQVDEFGQLRLQCKVISEPQSQISWRREDGQGLDGFEKRFRHHIERRPPHQVVSVDSGELSLNAIRRDQAGAYLCIASNGVQPGVSKRISVLVVNCRQSAESKAKSEPCGQLEPNAPEPGREFPETTASTPTSTTKRPQQPKQPSEGWSPLARQRANFLGRANVSTDNSTGDQQQQPDKSRSSRYNNNRQRQQQQRKRGPDQAVRDRRPARVESDGSSPASSLASCPVGSWQLLLAAFGMVWSFRVGLIATCSAPGQ